MSGAPDEPNVPQDDFASELVKLLVQVAWADHDVAPAEIEKLLTFARSSGLGSEQLTSLEAMLTGQAPLTPPNLGLLKQRRTEVLRSVKELLFEDRQVAAEEEAVFKQIASLLS